MMIDSYFGTHIHDEYSNITARLDCINRLPDLISYAQELGMSGLAITNHDNLSEIMEINRAQKKLRAEGNPFALGIGNEIYLVDEIERTPEGKLSASQKFYHFILIAKDKVGLDALIELSSRAWYRSESRGARRWSPTFKSDIDEILPVAKGHVIAATACLGGELNKLFSANDEEGADKFVDWCTEAFGKDDFYIELQPQPTKEQTSFNKWAVERYSDKSQFLIATDAHYQKEEDFPIFEAFLRSDKESRNVQEYYEFARMLSIEEIYRYLDYLPEEFVTECLANTNKIGTQLEFYDLAQDPVIPKKKDLQLPEETWKSKERVAEVQKEYPALWSAANDPDIQTLYCLTICLNELVVREKWCAEYLIRLDEEFDTMQFQSNELNDNFFAYANTMKWIFDLAWSIDCAVGPSRGSASGSLLNYLMDIVILDPIKYELPFWRYLNKTRTSPLDIDTDFQPSKRPALFSAIREHRGELGLTQVATLSTLTLRASIKAAARGYRSPEHPNGLDSDISLFLSGLIEVKRGFVATLHQTKHGDEITGYSVNHAFLKECNMYPGLLEIIAKIEKLIVGAGLHAAAVVLFDEEDPLTNHCSLMRSPSGDLCTALDLHTLEEAGCYKYDFLALTTLDIQATTFKLLQQDGVIDDKLSVRECFNLYINPNTIDYDNPLIWEKLYNDEVLSVFQWDAASGRKGILAAKPRTLDELTSLNGLIRLMTGEDEEDQIQRFVRIKENPMIFEQEMVEVGLSPEQRSIMHEELDKYNGCAATQESFMVLSQRLAGFTLKQADALRKTVAKKKMSEIQFQKDLFFSNLADTPQQIKEYLWRVVIAPSLGYGFSLNHALPYSVIGVQCLLLGGILFDPIYWQTGCLLQRSGALDEKGANHNEIAKAVAALSEQGVDIRLLDINVSNRGFSLSQEEGIIHFGFEGVKGLKASVIDKILALRPFTSFEDAVEKVKPDITSLVALIKAGAFDNFISRTSAARATATIRADTKQQLNGRNLDMILTKGLWPETTPELTMSKRVFRVTKHMKKITKKDPTSPDDYRIDDAVITFLDEIDYPHNGETIGKQEWKGHHDWHMTSIKEYLKDNQEEMLCLVNEEALESWTEKYFKTMDDWAHGEISSCGFCLSPHPYLKGPKTTDFFELPQEPKIDRVFKKDGRTIPLYELTMIAGIVIAKDKQHSSITLLTTTGPVEVKFRKQQFAAYEKQVSQVENGKKKVVERSWFTRGTGLIVHGLRQDDQFVTKYYSKSKMKHAAYKIVGVKEDGKFEVQKERKKGVLEDDETRDE